MKICTLFGHYKFNLTKEIEKSIREALIDAIVNKGVDTFYLGDKGKFDECCRLLLNDIKKKFPHIIRFLITTNSSLTQNKEVKYFKNGEYDGAIFPNLVGIPQHQTYKVRNEIMISQADYIIIFYNKSSQHMDKIFEEVKNSGKEFNNLGNKSE